MKTRKNSGTLPRPAGDLYQRPYRTRVYLEGSGCGLGRAKQTNINKHNGKQHRLEGPPISLRISQQSLFTVFIVVVPPDPP